MCKLTPQERQSINKQIKELNARLKNPRLTIEQVDELHKERKVLEAKIMHDRQAR